MFAATLKAVELLRMSVVTLPDVDLRDVLTLQAKMTVLPLQGQMVRRIVVCVPQSDVIYTD